ncbi:MAG: SRPBCC family protein [Acidobacteriaceae bacterium]
MLETSQDVKDTAAPNEIVITRVFAAPREMVYAAWSDPWQVGQWWGPKGFRSTITEMDQRPGGMWRLVMHGPDGADYPNTMQFIDIVPNHRVSFRTHGGKLGAPVQHFETVVLFEEEGSGTRLTFRMTFATAAERDDNVRTYGAIQGGEQMFDRLTELLEEKKSGKPKPSTRDHELRITRTFAAPRELVWQAWTDPAMRIQWAGSKPFPAAEIHQGTKPGDPWRIRMHGNRPGTDIPADIWMSGVLREIVPPELFVYTFAWENRASVGLPDDGQPHDTTITVRLEEHDGKTTMHFHQASFATAAERDGHNGGWTSSFERLEEFLISQTPKEAQ